MTFFTTSRLLSRIGFLNSLSVYSFLTLRYERGKFIPWYTWSGLLISSSSTRCSLVPLNKVFPQEPMLKWRVHWLSRPVSFSSDFESLTTLPFSQTVRLNGKNRNRNIVTCQKTTKTLVSSYITYLMVTNLCKPGSTIKAFNKRKMLNHYLKRLKLSYQLHREPKYTTTDETQVETGQ